MKNFGEEDSISLALKDPKSLKQRTSNKFEFFHNFKIHLFLGQLI